MEEIHRKAIKLNFVYLTNATNFRLSEALSAHLTQNGLFPTQWLESIQCITDEPKKRRKFWEDIPKRGPKAWGKILTCLRACGQSHVATQLEATEQALRQNRNLEKAPASVAPPPYSGGGEGGGDALPFSIEETSFGYTQMGAPLAQATDGRYKMQSVPRGSMLIINNVQFVPYHLDDRCGSNVDRDQLKNLFENHLGYIVDVKEDLTAQKMEDEVEHFAKTLGETDSCVLALLSHGHEGDQLFGVDGEKVPISNLVRYFDGHHCGAMRDKPKLVIVQACRGKQVSYAVPDGAVPPGVNQEQQYEEALKQFAALKLKYDALLGRVPAESDMLFAFATIPGYYSWRDPEHGSWFIQSLVKIFQERAHDTSLLDMLTKVNNEIAMSHGAGVRQVPAPTFTLRKPWYFNPPSKQGTSV